jgi:phage terminase large subunit
MLATAIVEKKIRQRIPEPDYEPTLGKVYRFRDVRDLEEQKQDCFKMQLPEPFGFLFEPHRYKSVRGGRGGAKSWAYADALLMKGITEKLRILCTRELMNTIADSVHKLLCDEIIRLGLTDEYTFTKSTISGKNGTEFLFKGLRFNIQEIKSTEGIDICWVEEAQSVSEESWKILIPTIRKEKSEIWLSWNTGEEKDATYQRFVINPPDDCVSLLLNWDENPFFPETLNKERLYCKKVDPDAYLNIWEGLPRFISDALVFKGKFIIGTFEAPKGFNDFKFGADWGFSQDPIALVRSFIIQNNLYIDYEACGVGVEFEDIPDLFDTVPMSRKFKITADNARPETISYVRRKGFNIIACKKAAKTKLGFVRDGIEFIRKFEHIYIHERCTHVIDEFQHYSYKKDKDGNILPMLQDSFNHCIDSLRYSLEDKIRGTTDWLAVMGMKPKPQYSNEKRV